MEMHKYRSIERAETYVKEKPVKSGKEKRRERRKIERKINKHFLA